MGEKYKWYLDERILQSQKLASIGELSAGIAHEINNPLAIIRQEAEWLQHILKNKEVLDARGVEELKSGLHQIIQEVDRCKDITHRLLDFARKRKPVIQAVELNKIIEDMALLVEREAKHNNIKIIRQYDANLPLIYSDGPLLRQVVLNLLNNAVHAIQKDGDVTITTCLSEDNTIDLIVSDTGCGIPKEHLDKIFDPFFTTKPEGKGTGLGLSICLGIIQRLGGRISVDSAVGQGTTFTIKLPRQPEAGGKNE
ncbi:MAG: ATP-binding protein [Desulfobaccales bacterium]|nr:ATP-binding protein [Desulfobaccales bacterium]